jgi:hypothetical protein
VLTSRRGRGRLGRLRRRIVVPARRLAGPIRPCAGALSRAASEPAGRWTDLDHLAGTWSVEEADAFDRQRGTTRAIDAELWR